MKLSIKTQTQGRCHVEMSLYDGDVLVDLIYRSLEPGTQIFDFEHDFALGKVYRLEIGRHEVDLYHSDRTFHEHAIKIVQVLIDDFWRVTDNRTCYDLEYVDFIKDRATWELTNDRFNDTIYFNGSLIYEIKTPIRGMFFK